MDLVQSNDSGAATWVRTVVVLEEMARGEFFRLRMLSLERRA